MNVVKINDKLTVAAQPELGIFSSLTAEGYSSILNARPDGEQSEQPGNAAESRAAQAVGLSYSFVPVTGPTITHADILAFQEVLRKAEGPVFAHCASGKRVVTLYALGEVLDSRMTIADVKPFGERHGFDLSDAVLWLERDKRRRPYVKGFFDPRTSSVQYVVLDPDTKRCAIIDPVLDFDEKSGATSTASADSILDYVQMKDLTVDWILDTHPHADHLSAAQYLKQKAGGRTAIGAHVPDVQQLWQNIYNCPELSEEGKYWDRLFANGDKFSVGSIEGSVIFSPGHTLASITYVIGDAAFIHDTVFMPDSGTARADFPGGSAKTLWNSIQSILSLPDETRLFTGHDYQPGDRHPRWESTVAEQKQFNSHLAGMDEPGFMKLRQTRDKQLPMPKLILHALQVNLRGGRLPEPESNGKRYLKLPLNALEGATW